MALVFGPAVSLAGPPGTAGGIIYEGMGAPEPTLGKAGDAYFRDDNQTFYVRDQNGWPTTGILLRGAMGINGLNANFFTGAGSPTTQSPALPAHDGDIYLDLQWGEISKYTNGEWQDQGYSIKGPQGDPGVAGQRGSQAYNGSGAPNIANFPNAAVNDYYFDTSGTGNMYFVVSQ
ncbi:MAG: hypothetical protein EOO40_00205 [Deltaproteobacteria bacterium]|nr:MAG: hypothetical protein EOO40_00205 [Deltaproteobacteria bacterium]